MVPRLSQYRAHSNAEKASIITTSWDDGHPLDLKLAALLAKYDIPATFYLPIENRERECMNTREIGELSASFDIGGHTYHHVNLPQVSVKRAEYEVREGKLRLEEIAGRELISFCYPQGGFSEGVKSVVKEAGFLGARTMKPLTRELKDLFEIGTTVHATHWRVAPLVMCSLTSADVELLSYMLSNELFSEAWDRVALETAGFVIRNGGIWHLWGHSWEIEYNSDWERLEAVLRNINELSREATRIDNSQLLRMYLDAG